MTAFWLHVANKIRGVTWDIQTQTGITGALGTREYGITVSGKDGRITFVLLDFNTGHKASVEFAEHMLRVFIRENTLDDFVTAILGRMATTIWYEVYNARNVGTPVKPLPADVPIKYYA